MGHMTAICQVGGPGYSTSLFYAATGGVAAAVGRDGLSYSTETGSGKIRAVPVS
jgi:hypothetical protein